MQGFDLEANLSDSAINFILFEIKKEMCPDHPGF